MYDVWSNKFAQDIFKQKYSMDGQESWKDTCERVVESVCGQLLNSEEKEKIFQLMLERKFIPGGRYLYSAGRPFHQVNNCFLFRAEDNREGWADAMHKATMALMTGGGIGFDYSKVRAYGEKIHKTGGAATGPLSLMHMVNEAGRHIMQGGQRRSAIWASLSWDHKDINSFLKCKDWSDELRALKEKDFNFALPMELTNISVNYNTEFFVAIENKNHPKHKEALKVWMDNCRQAFKTAEPGMAMNFLKDNESLRNAPVTKGTKVLTVDGYKTVESVLGSKVTLWTGEQWAETEFKKTKENADLVKVELTNGRNIVCDVDHPFIVKNYIGAGENKKTEYKRIAAKDLSEDVKIRSDLPKESKSFISDRADYEMGYFYGDGTDKDLLVKNNEKLSVDFIAGWFDADGCYTRNLLWLSSVSKEALIKCQESLDYYGIKSTVRRDSKGGFYPHNACYTLYVLSDSLLRFRDVIKTTRINIDLDDDYKPYRESEIRVKNVEFLEYKEDVYCCDVKVDEHSFMAEGVIISNCTEVVSEDDSDKCNLGTLWINRFDDKEDFREAVKYSTLFLLCGGIYSDVPSEKIREVGLKNNRIGLGLGGMHEWLMLRGYKYEVTPELHKWLNIYEQESDASAFIGAKQLGVNIPKGKRAIAPTGTIGILAETTTGIEPLFCKAYKRRYLKGEKWHYQYVVDGAVKRLLEKGVKIEDIQDAYDLTFKERVKFQADVQNYVDMAISSTCNLPPWGSELNNEESLKKNAKTLLKYAKRLRGFTCYPDGARGGQPLTRVELEEALAQEGQVFEEHEHECVGGICGI